MALRQHSRTVTLAWDGEWWTVSDEDGEFAKATEPHQALHYAADLMHGPGTGFSSSIIAEALERRHGKTERLR